MRRRVWSIRVNTKEILFSPLTRIHIAFISVFSFLYCILHTVTQSLILKKSLNDDNSHTRILFITSVTELKYRLLTKKIARETCQIIYTIPYRCAGGIQSWATPEVSGQWVAHQRLTFRGNLTN
jgi:hypothetical protein